MKFRGWKNAFNIVIRKPVRKQGKRFMHEVVGYKPRKAKRK